VKGLVSVGEAEAIWQSGGLVGDVLRWQWWSDRILARVHLARTIAASVTVMLCFPLIAITLGIAMLQGKFDETFDQVWAVVGCPQARWLPRNVAR
jgi:hypothetical protein